LDEEFHFALLRQSMVDDQIASRDVHDKYILDAMRNVPRHLFVPPEHRSMAYTDGPLPIGLGQTISQPYIVALMTQLLSVSPEDVILEVGTGSGYQAAILAMLVSQVHTIERHPELAHHAENLFKNLAIKNIQVHIGDGSVGLPEQSPFNGIIVTAAAPHVPQVLLQQLITGGRLVIPVGNRYGQYLERWQRKGDEFSHEAITPVAFVPLIGAAGWKD
jgi:protein-L-isoaspartate(D-aspartate) O-methyltransferase